MSYRSSTINISGGSPGTFTSLTVTGSTTITATSTNPALDVVQNGAGIGTRIRPGTDQTLALVIDKAGSTAGRLRMFVGNGSDGYTADDPYFWSNNADIHFRTGVGGANEPLKLTASSVVVTGDFMRVLDGSYSGYMGKASVLVTGGAATDLALRADADMVLAAGGATRILTLRSSGIVNIANLPTSAAGLAAGDLWNDSGTIKIV